MKLQILPPKKAAERAEQRVKDWERQQEKKALRSGLAATKTHAESKESKSTSSKKGRKKELSITGAHNESSPNLQLWRAINREDAQGAEAAIASGADISGKRRRHSPLVSAAGHGKVKMVEFLISKGIDINGRDDSGCTALMAAARKGHYRAAEILIRAGADVNATVDRMHWRGITALMFTAWISGDFRTARLLLMNGADVDLVDAIGKTALRRALESRNMAIVKLLREHGSKE